MFSNEWYCSKRFPRQERSASFHLLLLFWRLCAPAVHRRSSCLSPGKFWHQSRQVRYLLGRTSLKFPVLSTSETLRLRPQQHGETNSHFTTLIPLLQTAKPSIMRPLTWVFETRKDKYDKAEAAGKFSLRVPRLLIAACSARGGLDSTSQWCKSEPKDSTSRPSAR